MLDTLKQGLQLICLCTHLSNSKCIEAYKEFYDLEDNKDHVEVALEQTKVEQTKQELNGTCIEANDPTTLNETELFTNITTCNSKALERDFKETLGVDLSITFNATLYATKTQNCFREIKAINIIADKPLTDNQLNYVKFKITNSFGTDRVIKCSVVSKSDLSIVSFTNK